MPRLHLVASENTKKDLNEIVEKLDASSHSEAVRRALRFYKYYLTDAVTFNVVGSQEALASQIEDRLDIRLGLHLSNRSLGLIEDIKAMTMLASNSCVIRVALARYNYALREGRVLA